MASFYAASVLLTSSPFLSYKSRVRNFFSQPSFFPFLCLVCVSSFAASLIPASYADDDYDSSKIKQFYHNKDCNVYRQESMKAIEKFHMYKNARNSDQANLYYATAMSNSNQYETCLMAKIIARQDNELEALAKRLYQLEQKVNKPAPVRRR